MILDKDFDFKMYKKFWSNAKEYYEHKTDSYKNNRRKLAIYTNNLLFILIPYKNDNLYSFIFNEPKKIDEETLNKYWKKITNNEFFEKEITHIVI